MAHPDLDTFLTRSAPALGCGPVALVFVEDLVEVESTLRHHLALGFDAVLALGRDLGELPGGVLGIDHDVHAPGAVAQAVNRIAERAKNCWIYWCYNAEYLFFPFSESRDVVEMLGFHAEERRAAMVAFTLDLYAGDLMAAALGVDREDAWFDGTGYYARTIAVPCPEGGAGQIADIRGGFRWRYEDFVPESSQRLDRTALFRAAPGVRLGSDGRLSEPALNTLSSPWHRSLTAVVASFRAAKALRINPAPRAAIPSFRAPQSVKFEWRAQQLLDLGFMEPGQWFWAQGRRLAGVVQPDRRTGDRKAASDGRGAVGVSFWRAQTLRSRITTSTFAISVPAGGGGSFANFIYSGAASVNLPASSQ